MSRDGLLPPFGAKIHRRFRTLYVTTTVVAAIVAILAGILPWAWRRTRVDRHAAFALAFAIVCLGVLAPRVTRPDIDRPFKAPMVYLVAPAGALSAVLLMLGLPSDTWLWLILGLRIYFFYGMRHSRVGNETPAAEAQ